jgi:hypothetical protein
VADASVVWRPSFLLRISREKQWRLEERRRRKHHMRQKDKSRHMERSGQRNSRSAKKGSRNRPRGIRLLTSLLLIIPVSHHAACRSDPRSHGPAATRCSHPPGGVARLLLCGMGWHGENIDGTRARAVIHRLSLASWLRRSLEATLMSTCKRSGGSGWHCVAANQSPPFFLFFAVSSREVH